MVPERPGGQPGGRRTRGLVFFSWEAASYPDPVKFQFSSYAACTGDWFVQTPPNGSNWQQINASNNGLIYLQSNRRMADITDGTSNTLALGERGHGLLSPTSATPGTGGRECSRVMFTAQWPMNPQKKLSDGIGERRTDHRCQPLDFLLGLRLPRRRLQLRLHRRLGPFPQGLDR